MNVLGFSVHYLVQKESSIWMHFQEKYWKINKLMASRISSGLVMSVVIILLALEVSSANCDQGISCSIKIHFLVFLFLKFIYFNVWCYYRKSWNRSRERCVSSKCEYLYVLVYLVLYFLIMVINIFYKWNRILSFFWGEKCCKEWMENQHTFQVYTNNYSLKF